MMGLVYPGIPTDLTLRLKNWLNLDTFIETGTYLGNTAIWASDHFKNVYTLEASHNLWLQARKMHEDRKNIVFVHGHSGEVLRETLSQIKVPSLFWLDAHWSSGITYGENDECPLIHELEAIQNRQGQDCILIDDARLFMAPPPKHHRLDQWPALDEVFIALTKAIDSPYTVIVDDVIVSIPDRIRSQFAAYLQEKITIEVTKQNLNIRHQISQRFRALLRK